MKAKWARTSRSTTRCSGSYYPFSRLTGPANILVMPGLQSANISSKLLRALGGESVLGPYLLGMTLPVQIAPMTASASDLVTLAVLAAAAPTRASSAQARRPPRLIASRGSVTSPLP